jgi:choice-of-anchor B domain-containing protein
MARLFATSILVLVLAGVMLPSAPLASTELSLLGIADPCDCIGSPFPWDYNDVWGFAAGGAEYAVLGSFAGTYIIDVTVPAAPVVASFVPGPESNWRDMKKTGNYILATNETSGGLQVIDVSNPYGAFEATAVDDHFTTGHNLYIDETSSRAFIFGASGQNLTNPILDISNPLAPTLLGSYDDRYLHDGYVRGDILYGAKIFPTEPHAPGLYVLDVSNPAQIDTLSIVTWPNSFTHNTWTTEDGSYCLTTDENDGGHVRIWDVQNLGAVLPVSEYTQGEDVIVHNVFVRGDQAFISYYTEGVRVVDLSDITNPIELGFYDTDPVGPRGGYGGCWGVYPFLPSGTILASDVEHGLFIFAPIGGQTAVAPVGVASASARPLLDRIYPNPFNPATTIALTIPVEGAGMTLRMAVYDAAGRLVRTLKNGTLAAGEHRLTWNGVDDAGNPSASGSYFLRLESDAVSESRSLTLLK